MYVKIKILGIVGGAGGVLLTLAINLYINLAISLFEVEGFICGERRASS